MPDLTQRLSEILDLELPADVTEDVLGRIAQAQSTRGTPAKVRRRLPKAFAWAIAGGGFALALAVLALAAHSRSDGEHTPAGRHGSEKRRLSAHAANGMILSESTGRPVSAVDADGPITAATPDGDGGWFIGGGFSAIDGHPRANLAHIHADGSLDPGWRGPALGPPAALSFLSLALSGDRLLVAGGFATSGNRRPGVIALDASNGSLESGWTIAPVCADGAWAVSAAAGRAWVATACAAPPCLVAMTASTGHLLAWSPGIAAVGETLCVNALAISAGDVFFTGGFTAVGGVPRNGIAAARASDGRVVGEFAPSGRCAQDGHAIATAAARVFVGGDGCPVAAFASSDGRALWSWSRTENDETTAALLVHSGRLYVGGTFDRIAGVAANGFVALDPATGHTIATWHPAPGTQVYALSSSNGRILIGTQ